MTRDGKVDDDGLAETGHGGQARTVTGAADMRGAGRQEMISYRVAIKIIQIADFLLSGNPELMKKTGRWLMTVPDFLSSGFISYLNALSATSDCKLV